MRIAYIFLQCTWGFLQTLFGFVLFMVNFRCRHFGFHGAVATAWKYNSGISLGLFVFVPDNSRLKSVLPHEYGHTIQSLILGPFYLLAIGLPSLIWAGVPFFVKLRKQRNISYYSFYTEKWADFYGKKLTPKE